MSAFQTWFEAQYGKRPCKYGDTDADLRRQVACGREAEQELCDRVDWDHRQQAALYAWQARGAQSE